MRTIGKLAMAIAVLITVLAILAGSAVEAADDTKLPPPATVTVDFKRDIQPIFSAKCLNCHGAQKPKGGFRLDAKAEAFSGGGSGRAFEPGKSAESLLVGYVAGTDPNVVMPPKGERLTAAQVGLIRAWIDQGAAWPEESLNSKKTDNGSNHWAFQPVNRPQLPADKNNAWVRNPIDAFVLEKLDSKGVTPSPEADRATLIRRLSLDLLGLPPTPAEVAAFETDRSPEAYEKLVAKILASPHYGERWGRHWLDLARYADSDGYEKDSPRPNAWRYRDWVINALNRDLPFDAFTIEQLAGDLLPNADLQTRAATGFHRNTLTNREGGVDQEEYRIKAVVDRVNTTGTVWLGLTVGCTQCHTHKYDPLLHKEYYGLFAFFNQAKEEDIPVVSQAEQAAYEKAKAAYDAEHAKLVNALEQHDKGPRILAQAKWEANSSLKAPEDIHKILAKNPEKRSKEEVQKLRDHHRSIDPEWVKLDKELKAHTKKTPLPPAAKIPALVENPSAPKTHILIRGDFLRQGDEVGPGTPAVLPQIKASGKKLTRLELARWLVDSSNPLTTRVTVNRIWHQLFGRGLVTTLDDFGIRGEKPSHPGLLDWLASEFALKGWSQKKLITTIVSSATYRQSSKYSSDLKDIDPNNTWLARQNRLRLEAEVLRDVNLDVSGLLTPVIGGPSVHPPQPQGISELTYAGGAKWVEAKGADRYRRGMYTWFQRTSPYPMLMTFDAPDSNVCLVKRERSNTPLQALTLLNDTTFFECAQALGIRLLDSKGTTEDKLRFLYQTCLARVPSEAELKVLTGLHSSLLADCRDNPLESAKLFAGTQSRGDQAEAASWVALARAVLNLDEFVTRE